MVKGRTFALRQSLAIIDLLVRRSRNGQRQWLDRQEAVTGIEGDRVVRITHHCLAINRDSSNQSSLLSTSYRVGCGILLRNQSAIGAIQSIPNRIAIFGFEQIAFSAGNADISILAGIIIKLLLTRIRETNVECLACIVVRTRTARVRVPLVSTDADVHTDWLDCQ